MININSSEWWGHRNVFPVESKSTYGTKYACEVQRSGAFHLIRYFQNGSTNSDAESKFFGKEVKFPEDYWDAERLWNC